MAFYQYKAKVEKIVDGDTVIAMIDFGLGFYARAYCRLAYINAPEPNSTDEQVRIAAQAAKLYLGKILPIGSSIIVDTKKLDPYKRPIVNILLAGQTVTISNQMFEAGHAVKVKYLKENINDEIVWISTLEHKKGS